MNVPQKALDFNHINVDKWNNQREKEENYCRPDAFTVYICIFGPLKLSFIFINTSEKASLGKDGVQKGRLKILQFSKSYNAVLKQAEY